jgi:hypothetical protein
MGSRGGREERVSGSNRYENDQAVDLDDINFENNDQDYDDSGNPTNARNRSRRGYSNAGGDGKANRISAYRKSQMQTNKGSSRDDPDARD